ncbi:MAG: hypothetical protein JWQ24_5548 [Tardiphaga sp.]|nr:hypothetical protein [Tardiphaga sp.]
MFVKRLRLLRVAVTVVILAAVTALVSAPPIAASAVGVSRSHPGRVGVRLLDIPADTANDPRTHAYIVDSLLPGTTFSRRIELSNTTSSSLHVDAFAAAATIENGSFVGKPGHEANELSTWTTLSRSALEVRSHSTSLDTVTIAIPTDAAPGETYAVVWAEVSTVGSGGVKLTNRVGIRIYLDVRGNNPVASSFTIDSMTAERSQSGRPIVLAQVHNTGGRAIDLTGTLQLKSVSGSLTAGPYEARLGTTVAPGQSEPIMIEPSDALANGPWTALLELQSGLLKESAQAVITFPAKPGAGVTVRAHPPTNYLGILVIVLSLVAILVAAGIAILLIRQRRRRRSQTSS